MTRRFSISSMAILLAGISCNDPQHDFERMLTQPRTDPYERSSYFPNGISMQRPPEGTVLSMQLATPPDVAFGCSKGQYTATVPIQMTPPLREQGRGRFALYCATCHGLEGKGDTMVARAMETTKPRSLVAPPVLDYPPGHVYSVIREGFKMMPAYDTRLDTTERWAVVAYVGRLQEKARPRQSPADAGSDAAATACDGGKP